MIDAAERRAKWKADWLAAWSDLRAQKLWMAATVRLYPSDVVAAAANKLASDEPSDAGGLYEKGYYADEAGIYRMNVYGCWDGWSVVQEANGFPLRTQKDGAKGGSRRGVARKGEIDWDRLTKEHVAAAEKTWDKWQQSSIERRAYEAAMSDVDETETRQAYVGRHSSLLTYAFIDDAESWRERAPHLGPYALPNTTYANDLATWLERLPDEHVLAIVCHE